MKAEALVALADACRVSLEWLATGRGEPRFGSITLPLRDERGAETGRRVIITAREGHFAEAAAEVLAPTGTSTRDLVQINDLSTRRRVLEAYEQAGGFARLVNQLQLPEQQLVNLVIGETVPRAVAAKVAVSLGIEVVWGDPQPPAPGASLKSSSIRPDALFSSLDMTRMGDALEAAAKAFNDRGTRPSWRRLAQVAALLYDGEDEPSETIRAQAAEDKDASK